MSDLTLSETSIRAGTWYGVLTGSEQPPDIEVRHHDQIVPDIEVEAGDDGWNIRIPIPAETIADGVQTFAIFDRGTGDTLGQFTLIAGEALGDDIRAEVELLRAELDMLKRAFRRHCVESE